MLMLLTLLLSTHTSLDVGAADVNAILASAAAGSENIYGTGQCADRGRCTVPMENAK